MTVYSTPVEVVGGAIDGEIGHPLFRAASTPVRCVGPGAAAGTGSLAAQRPLPAAATVRWVRRDLLGAHRKVSMCRIATTYSTHATRKGLYRAVRAFEKGGAQRDDVTTVVMRRLPRT